MCVEGRGVASVAVLLESCVPLVTCSNPTRDFGFFFFMWGSYPASLRNVGGSTQLPDHAWYNVQRGTLCLPPTVKLARWSSASAFDWRSRNPWLESFKGLTWISLDTINKYPRLQSTKVWIRNLRRRCLCMFDIPGRHVGCNSFPRETRTLVSKCSPMTKGG